MLRHRQRLTQAELAARANVGRWKIVDIEAGRLANINVAELETSFGALEARLVLKVTYRGAEIDRLLDERHARLAGAFVRLLQQRDWEVRVEVSFNDYGDRGSIDILAWNPATRVVLVVEIKSELASIEGLLAHSMSNAVSLRRSRFVNLDPRRPRLHMSSRFRRSRRPAVPWPEIRPSWIEHCRPGPKSSGRG
jgi:hypothetical protein